MQDIRAVLFDPVGCLAEFPAQEFDAIAEQVFGVAPAATVRSGSEAYWRVLQLMEAGGSLTASQRQQAEALEIAAVDRVELYEDVVPALAELRALGVSLIVATSLSGAAVARFIDRFSLRDHFSAVWSRDNAAGVRAAPIAKALEEGHLAPEQAMVLVDTTEGVTIAKNITANSMLMINDYDDGRRLAMEEPTGGIISLHELPDVIRFIVENAKAAALQPTI